MDLEFEAGLSFLPVFRGRFAFHDGVPVGEEFSQGRLFDAGRDFGEFAAFEGGTGEGLRDQPKLREIYG
jgi:hypothetical protein